LNNTPAEHAEGLAALHGWEVPAHVPADLVRDFDYFAVDAVDGDIHLGWRRLQDGPRIFYTPRNGGHWVVTRAADLEAIFCDAARFSSREATIPPAGKPVRLPLLEWDPPGHQAWRQLLVPLFSPRAIGEIEPFARNLAVELIEAIRPRGECEFISEFSQQMPIAVFMRMANLPFADRDWLLARAETNVRSGSVEDQNAAFVAIMEYVSEKLAFRRGGKGKDLLTTIANGVVDGHPITHDDAVGLAALVMFAGLDTVVSMFGHFMRHLALHPQHRSALLERPELRQPAMEELLRRHGVTQMARIVAMDTDFQGVSLRAGDMVLLPTLLYGLDEARFPDAAEVRIDRSDSRHLAFGTGAHRCIGSLLARTELRILLDEWLPRIPNFWINPNDRVEVKSGKVNAISRLPLTWQ
jgi:cytochrome P450